MPFGLTFTTNNGRQFELDQIQPGVYLGTVNLSGNASFYFPALNGQADIYAEMVNRVFTRSGNGMVSSLLQYTYSRPARGQLVINFQATNISSFTARFALFARYA